MGSEQEQINVWEVEGNLVSEAALVSTEISRTGFHHQTQLSYAFLSIWVEILLLLKL